MKQNNENKSQQGNAIFMIIVAIALFAALGYAVTNTSRTSTSLLTDEEATAYANQIIAYGNDVKSAVKRMQLRGINDEDFHFGNTTYVRLNGANLNVINHNPNCTRDKCKLFKLSGGGLVPKTFENAGADQSADPISTGKAGHVIFRQVSVDGVGTDEAELTMEVLAIKPEICNKINQLLYGIDAISESYETANFGGTYSDSLTNKLGDSTINYDGKTSICNNIPSNHSHFIQVLITR